uniref:Cytochrome c oxidase subunit 3 n=1 Tax=Siphonosoma cumanense TaxID=6444 RepID=A0A7D4ZP25_SIPCU|nr:cytochrome c oxidase subunit 3 [Siphonosoma cumanense]QKS32595.1 cytochrome c oxidase subunit 3 [Siphonosoma cumanense]
MQLRSSNLTTTPISKKFYFSPFYLITASPWPLTGALGGCLLASGLVAWFHLSYMSGIVMGLLMIILTMYQWWRDLIREATFMGYHTEFMMKSLRLGMILFIVSEVLFFFAFFWAFFHSSLAPTPEIGCTWPPTAIQVINPFSVPLLNTGVLLASGVTVTWAHHALLEKDRQSALQSLTLTVLLGIYFTYLQATEYAEASFTIADSVYGTTFFVTTGFHGLHVMIGTIFLLVSLLRIYMEQFSSKHHFGFEAAAWYWHFVDVVWLFLFVFVYWWGS